MSVAARVVSATKPWTLIEVARRGGVVAGLGGGAAVEVEERGELRGLAADDGEGERQAEGAGADDRLRRAADGDPDGQAGLRRAGVDAAAVDLRGEAAAGPGQALAVVEGEEEAELLVEERVVVVEVVAEEREGLDEGAAADHDLGAAVGEGVEGGELLEDADRVVGGEDGDGAGQADAGGAGGGAGEGDGRGGGGVVGAVVLAEAEDVEAELVGEGDLLDEVAQALRRADRAAGGGVGADVGEGVEAELHPGSFLSAAAPAAAGGRRRALDALAQDGGHRVVGVAGAVVGEEGGDLGGPAPSGRPRAQSRKMVRQSSGPMSMR